MTHDPRSSAASAWNTVLPPEALTFAPMSATDLVRDHPHLRPVVVEGLVREGEVMNIVAAPKVGKSWLVHALALSVASGKCWIGLPTTRGRVLIIDAELHPETLASRLRRVRADVGVGDADFAVVDVWWLRGRRVTIEQIEEALRGVQKSHYRLIIVDAIYRFLPKEGEENKNETMAQVYACLDRIAANTGAAVAVVHHASKGNQADKAVTDVGSGAGAQSRAADTHLVLRQHEADGCVVVDAAVRSFPPLDPFVIRDLKPGWALAPELDATKLRRPNRGKQKDTDKPESTGRVWTPEDFARDLIGKNPIIKDEIIAVAKSAGVKRSDAESLLRRAVEKGAAVVAPRAPSDPYRYMRAPGSFDAGGPGEGVGPCPPPPERSAPGGVGGTTDPPPPHLENPIRGSSEPDWEVVP